MLPLIIQIERTDEHEADTVAFNKSPVRIGRNPLNDLPLEEGFVSQWHGVVRFNAERTTVLDLGSTNRITVNGARIERNVEVPVDHTSDVRIGSLRLHLLRVEAPSELFDRRRSRSAFARVGNPEQGDVTRSSSFTRRPLPSRSIASRLTSPMDFSPTGLPIAALHGSTMVSSVSSMRRLISLMPPSRWSRAAPGRFCSRIRPLPQPSS